MPRPLQRVRLESGLKLDLNKLGRRGLVCPGTTRVASIRWTSTYTGEEVANGVIYSNMEGSSARKDGFAFNSTTALIKRSFWFPSHAILAGINSILSAR